MKRRTKNLIIEAFIVGIILTALTILIIPKFLAAQNINTLKHFPDTNFRRAVENFMGVKQFTAEEASKKKGSFYCLQKNIHDMTGIEYFPSINHIDCQANQIEKLDLSKNRDLFVLQCCSNRLKNLDISQNFLLQEITCYDNKLEHIDVSNNKNLTRLSIFDNNIKELDLSQNRKLNILQCTRNNLRKIDLTNNPNLAHFDINGNEIYEINLKENIVLNSFSCSDNKLTSLVLDNQKKLRSLNCNNNQITKLDLRNNPKLKSLECNQNQITEILLPDKCNLLTVKCANNQLEDLSELLKLKFFQYLDIRHNNLDIKQLEGAREMLKNMYENGFATKGVEYLPQKNVSFADAPESWTGDLSFETEVDAIKP